MLQYSKFVNTKGTGPKRGAGGIQFPIFSKSVQISTIRKQEPAPTVEMPKSADTAEMPKSAQTVEMVKPVAAKAPLPMHPSVNLGEMQRQEELSNKDKDWLSFFMGMTNPSEPIEMSEREVSESYLSESTELVHLPTAESIDPFADAPMLTSYKSSSPNNPFSAGIDPIIMTPAAAIFVEPASEMPSAPINTATAKGEPAQQNATFSDLQKATAALQSMVGGPVCLNEIFNEMISEDKIFKRACT